MPIAQWQDEYCTGDQKVDQEHQELFQIVNILHEAVNRAETHQVLQEILENLASHTIAHFQTEEELMKTNQYPGIDRHKQAHDGLTTKVVNLIQKFNSHETVVTADLTGFLTEWLVHHIKGEDQKMIQFFREKSGNQYASLSL